MIASVVMLVGVMAIFSVLVSSGRANSRSERNQTVAAVAQSTVEQILAQSYATVGMSSTPTNSGSGLATDPLRYVTTSPVGYAYDWLTPGTGQAWVTGGTLAPSSAWTSGAFGGTVYRFITWVADPCASCLHAQDYKRVTVVVTTTTAGAPFIDSTITGP